MFAIPQDTKQFSQTNESDMAGNICQTKNINFDHKGYIRLEDRTRVIADEDQYTDLDNTSGGGIVAIAYDSDNSTIHIAGTKNVYSAAITALPTFTKNAGTGFPTLSSSGNNDMLFWQKASRLMLVNSGSDLYNYNGTTWSTTSSLGGDVLCEFVNLRLMASAEDNVVKTFTSSFVLDTTLTLPEGYDVTSMAWNQNKMCIATTNNSGGDAIVFEWDGSTTSADNGYPVLNAHTVYSVVPYGNGFAAVTSKGEIIYISGGISNLGYLPIYFMEEEWDSSPGSGNLSRKVLSRGMAVDGNQLYIAVNHRFAEQSPTDRKNREQKFPGGVYCYDPKVGVYLRWTIDGSSTLKTDAIATTSVNTTTNVITVAGQTVPETGTPAFYYDGGSTALAPLIDTFKYFVIKESSTTLKLALSYEDAIAGTAIDLTGTGNNAQFIRFHDNAGFGGVNNLHGALYKTPAVMGSFVQKSIARKLFIGGAVQRGTNITSNLTCLCAVEAYQENRGFISTPKLEADGMQDLAQKVIVKYEQLFNEDKIILRYRKKKNTLKDFAGSSDVTGTWTDSNTFTTTENMSDVVAGNLIEIMSGTGAGYRLHVSSISENAGTYTVNLTESVQNVTANDVMRFFISNWKYLGEITPDDTDLVKEFKIDEAATWYEVEAELRGERVGIERIIVPNASYKPTEINTTSY